MKILNAFKAELIYLVATIVFKIFLRGLNAELLFLHDLGMSHIELFRWNHYYVLIYFSIFVLFCLLGALLIYLSLKELCDDTKQDGDRLKRVFRAFIVVMCIVSLFHSMNVIIFAIVFTGILVAFRDYIKKI